MHTMLGRLPRDVIPTRRSARASATVLPIARPLLAAAVVACGGSEGGSTSPWPSRQPRDATVRVVSGAGVTDTVLSAAPAPLVVEIRDSLGEPVEGAAVRFEVAPPLDGTRVNESALFICGVPAPQCGSFYSTVDAVDTTGSDGIASVTIRLGTVAGPTKVYVNVLGMGLRDSAPFTVLPGNAAYVSFAVADTMVSVGGSYALGAVMTDQYRNRRDDPLGYSTDGAVATVDMRGKITGRTIGRGTVTAGAGGLSVTASVSVVPAGRVAAYSPGDATHASSIVEFDLDGGNYRVRKTVAPTNGAFPAWSADGSVLTYTEPRDDGRPQLVSLDGTGAAAPAVSDPAVFLSEEGRYSRDGTYLFFYGESNDGFGVWRARVGGGASAELLGGARDGAQPSPSSDGARVAFVDGAGLLRVLTIATGAVLTPGDRGSFPRWQPGGELIGFASSAGVRPEMWLVRVDGSERRLVATGYEPGADWSPDGTWLVASSAGQVALLRASDGMTLPLHTSRPVRMPAWKP